MDAMHTHHHLPPDENSGKTARQMGRQKLLAVLLSLLMMATVLLPVTENWQHKPADSFPLSYYPMFSQARNGKTSLTYLVGVDKEGNTHRISYHRAGTGGFNQVRKQIAKRASRNPQKLCKDIAFAVANRNKKPEILIDTVKIVKGSFAFDRFFAAGEQTPERRKEICACAVERNVTLSKLTAP
jgi:hypothetical protein